MTSELREALERTAEELFVGRDRELAQLEAAREAAATGRGRIFLVAGEPGIGKTRLVERVAERAAECGTNVLWGRCWEGDGAPAFWPWIQIVRAYMRGCDVSSLAARLGLGAPYVAQVVPEVRDLIPNLTAAPPLDSEQALFRLYDSFAAFFCNAAVREPLVLVLDDLHWADKSSLLLLQFLARELREARILVLATYRDVEVSMDHPLADALPRLRRERTVERLLLRGLPEPEVRTLLEAMRGESVPEEFAQNLAHETAGNPFFIKEILRHLLDEGVAVAEAGRRRTDEIRLPESVREVIGRRIARLGDRCRRLLTTASVVGREFAVELVALAMEISSREALEILDEARAAQIVEEQASAPGRFRFSHALIRETLYAQLGTAERIRLHRIVAEALERLHARDLEWHLGELAHHFYEAMTGGDAAKAAAYATRAGDRAAEQLAYAEAAGLYGRALQALALADPADEKRRCELLLRYGEMQWGAGGFENPARTFEEAAQIALRLGEGELVARAALVYGGPGVGLAMAHEMVREAELLKKALEMLPPEDSRLRARVMARLAGRRHLVEEAYWLGRPALEMARRLGDKPTLAYVLNAMAWGTWGPDDLEENFRLSEEMIRVAEEVADGKLIAEGHLWRACCELQVGDVDAADRDVEFQLRFAESSRQPYQRWLAALNRAARAMTEARLDEAEQHHREAMAAATELWGAGLDLVVVALDRGVGPLIRRHRQLVLDREIAAYEKMGSWSRAPIWRVAVAGSCFASGRVDQAKREFDRLAADGFEAIPRDIMWMYSMLRLAELAAELGDVERSRILYDLLLPHADRCIVSGTIMSYGSCHHPLGMLATVLERFDDAETHFQAALAMNQRMRTRLWVMHVEHHYARMLVRRDRDGDRERASTLLASALATARECGVHAFEPRILTTMADAGIEVPSSSVKPAPMAPLEAVFRRDGDFWMLAYEGGALRLKDSKGLQYIAELLREEGKEIHAADLAGGRAASTEGAPDRGHAGEILDAQARSEYRQRVEDLESELEEATRWSDVGRAARLREEIDFLKDELSAAFGVGGRSRKAGDVTERARKAVASRIRDTIERIRKEHRPLALHLENAIRTGAFCSYEPDRPPGWQL